MLRDGRVEQRLIQFGRYQRFGFPPDIDRLPEREVKALDTMSLSLRLPLADVKENPW